LRERLHFRARASRLRFRLRRLVGEERKKRLAEIEKLAAILKAQTRSTPPPNFGSTLRRGVRALRRILPRRCENVDARRAFAFNVAIDNRTGLLLETSLQTAPSTFCVLFERRAQRRLNHLGATSPTPLNHLGATRPTPLNLLGATRPTSFNHLGATRPTPFKSSWSDAPNVV